MSLFGEKRTLCLRIHDQLIICVPVYDPKQAPVITGMSRTRNSRLSMLVHMNETEPG